MNENLQNNNGNGMSAGNLLCDDSNGVREKWMTIVRSLSEIYTSVYYIDLKELEGYSLGDGFGLFTNIIRIKRLPGLNSSSQISEG